MMGSFVVSIGEPCPASHDRCMINVVGSKRKDKL